VRDETDLAIGQACSPLRETEKTSLIESRLEVRLTPPFPAGTAKKHLFQRLFA